MQGWRKQGLKEEAENIFFQHSEATNNLSLIRIITISSFFFFLNYYGVSKLAFSLNLAVYLSSYISVRIMKLLHFQHMSSILKRMNYYYCWLIICLHFAAVQTLASKSLLQIFFIEHTEILTQIHNILSKIDFHYTWFCPNIKDISKCPMIWFLRFTDKTHYYCIIFSLAFSLLDNFWHHQPISAGIIYYLELNYITANKCCPYGANPDIYLWFLAAHPTIRASCNLHLSTWAKIMATYI